MIRFGNPQYAVALRQLMKPGAFVRVQDFDLPTEEAKRMLAAVLSTAGLLEFAA